MKPIAENDLQRRVEAKVDEAAQALCRSANYRWSGVTTAKILSKVSRPESAEDRAFLANYAEWKSQTPITHSGDVLREMMDVREYLDRHLTQLRLPEDTVTILPPEAHDTLIPCWFKTRVESRLELPVPLDAPMILDEKIREWLTVEMLDDGQQPADGSGV